MPINKIASAAARRRSIGKQVALLRRGRAFLLQRQDHIRDPDCLIVTIMACIAEGACTRDEIIRNVPRFVGHSYPQVAAEVDRYEGRSPIDHYWYRDDAKTYHLHFEPEPQCTPIELKRGAIRRGKPKKVVAETAFGSSDWPISDRERRVG